MTRYFVKKKGNVIDYALVPKGAVVERKVGAVRVRLKTGKTGVWFKGYNVTEAQNSRALVKRLTR